MKLYIYNKFKEIKKWNTVICYLFNALLCLIKLFNGLFNSVKVLNLTSKMLGTDPDPNFFLRISNTDVLEGNW